MSSATWAGAMTRKLIFRHGQLNVFSRTIWHSCRIANLQEDKNLLVSVFTHAAVSLQRLSATLELHKCKTGLHMRGEKKWSNIEEVPPKNSHLQLILGNVIHCAAFRLAHAYWQKTKYVLKCLFSVRVEAIIIVKGVALSVILIYF